MSGKIIEVGMRISGDAKGAQNALGVTRSDLSGLASDASKIKLLDGDSIGATAVLGKIDTIRQELGELAATEHRIALFDSLISASERVKGELVQATAQVNRLKATLSEAYDSGADKSLIRALEKQLATAEKAAARAEIAVQRTTTEIVRLNLESDKTGVSIGNLAQKKAELAAASERAKNGTAALAVELDKERQYQAHLANETERLAKAEKQAKENRFVEETRQAAVAAQKAAEYTGWWATELAKVEKAEREVAARANAVNAAFSTLGIRTAKQIEAELLQINQELLRLAQRSNLSGEEFDRAFAAGQKRIAALRTELKGVPGDIDPVANKASMLTDLMKGLAVSFTGVELARQFVTVNIELENIERSFIAVTGSTAKASQEMEYARGVANRLGIDVLSTARSYSDMMAATKGTSVEGEITRKVFESVSRAMAIAGRTSAETAGALNALSQMASKGVVQMEELRGQLGDRLPGALGAAAEGLGITTAQLIKLVESGQMTVEELFPALSAGLEKLYGQAAPTETMSQRWAHFRNGIAETFGAVADTGVWVTLGTVLDGVTEVVMWLATGVTTVTSAFFALVKVLAVTTAAVVNMDFSNLKDELKGISDEMLDTINRVASLTQVSKILKPAIDESSQAHKGAKDATAEHNKALAQLKSAYAYATEAAGEATKQTQANIDAKNAEATATLATANAFGNETQKLLAKADATRVAAAGSAALAEKRKEELALAKANLSAIQEEANAHGPATEAQQKVIDALRKTVESRQADADKAQAQAQSSAVAAAQAEVEANAHADNSSRVLELKAAYEQAALAADVLRAQKLAGVDVGKALEEADIRAGKAAALYRDALSDQTAAIQRNLSVKEAGIGVEQASIRLAIEQQRTIADVARARGDERGAIEALLKIKQLEIQLAELTAKAKAAEAAAQLELVKANRAKLEALGPLTAAQEAELKALEAGAEVKKIESEIARETAKRMHDLAEAYQQTGDAASGANRGIHDIGVAAESSVAGVDRLTNSLNRMNAAGSGTRRGGGGAGGGGVGGRADNGGQDIGGQGDQTISPEERRRMSQVGILENSSQPAGSSSESQGFLDGGRQGDQSLDIAGMMYRKGASAEEVKAAEKYFGELYARNSAASVGNIQSQGAYALRQKMAMADALDKALAYGRQEIATGTPVDMGRSVADIQRQKMATQDFSKDYSNYSGNKHLQRVAAESAQEARAQPIKTIRLQLDAGNGKRAEVNVAGDRELNDFMRALEAAGMTANKSL